MSFFHDIFCTKNNAWHFFNIGTSLYGTQTVLPVSDNKLSVTSLCNNERPERWPGKGTSDFDRFLVVEFTLVTVINVNF